MKKIFRIAPIIYLCILVTSCQRQTSPAAKIDSRSEQVPLKWSEQQKQAYEQKLEQEQAPKQDKDQAKDKVEDPYFNGNDKLVSSSGPGTITRNILQDKTGNIWLATWEGIVRYDGKSFINLTNKLGLKRYRAFSLLEDRTGVIWIGTIGAGLYRYDANAATGDQSGFTNLTTENGLVHNDIQCLYEDRKGNIWIGTRDGLSCYDGKTFRNFSTADGIPNADINGIIEDASGKLWFGSRGEAFTFDGKNFTQLMRMGGAPFINVRMVIRDRKDNIWLGGKDGLWWTNGNTFFQVHDHFTGYIFEDSKGNLWTSRSLPKHIYEMAMYRHSVLLLPSSLEQTQQIANPRGQVFGITEDSDGNIWFGTENGAGRYDGDSIHYFNE